MTPPEGRWPVLSVLVVPAILAAAVTAYVAFEGQGALSSGTAELGMDCAGGSGADRAVFLVDLRKPLDAAHVALPGTLIRAAAGEVDAGTELAVYTLSPHAEAPRALLGRLCKTFDAAGLVAESAKHRVADDCDVPAQAASESRSRAMDFCRQRDALARRIDALAVETLGQAAGGATYLVEALEATARDFGDAPGMLYVFSDLVQHAPWFSHAERSLSEWDYDDMVEAWSALPVEETLRGFPPETKVRIHYVPRKGTTELEEPRDTHKRLWEAYFRGAEIAFDDQPAMAEYVPASLDEGPTAVELAAYELERLRHSSALVERDRRDLARAQEQVAAERRELEADRRELAAEREQLEAAQAQILAGDGVRFVAGDQAAGQSKEIGGD